MWQTVYWVNFCMKPLLTYWLSVLQACAFLFTITLDPLALILILYRSNKKARSFGECERVSGCSWLDPQHQQSPLLVSSHIINRWRSRCKVGVSGQSRTERPHSRRLLISCLPSWFDKWWTAEEVVWTKFVVFLNSNSSKFCPIIIIIHIETHCRNKMML